MTLVNKFRAIVIAVAKQAVAEKADTKPLGDGLMLVKEDSAEGQSRLGKSGIVAERIEVSGISFLVCNA